MEVRSFKKTERKHLLDAINKLWAENHIYVRNPDVLEHFILNSPYVKEFAGENNYSFRGIWDEESIVGLLGVIPEKINVFGEEGLSTTTTIWVTDKTYPKPVDGLDLFQFINDKQPMMNICLGISKYTYFICQALGWYMIDDLPRWIVVTDREKVVKNLLPDDSVSCYLPQSRSVQLENKGYTIDNVLNQTRWDRYYKEKFAPRMIGTVRDYEFLKWRYMESPVLKYHFLAITDADGEYHGLAVIRIEKILDGKFTIGRILEFIAVEAEASIALANAVLAFDKDVLMWDFYCLSDITAFGLESVGFRRLPDWMDKVMMPTRFQPVDYSHMKINGTIYLDEKVKDKLNPINNAQWYITKGDADQDRAN